MTQPAAPRSAGIQQQPAAETAPTDAPNAGGLSFGWRIALFIWTCAFICLVAFELLNTVVRTLWR